jgi:hypothetical protein
MTVNDVFSALTTIMGTIWDVFGSVTSVVVDNKLLFVPVLLAFAGTIVLFCISLFRKLGVRGLASSGRRRRRR